MKILVIGGAGFIGSAVIRHFIENTQRQVKELAQPLLKNGYGKYLIELVKE